MANAYSLLHNYQQDLYSPNLELINTALQFKQQSLNANREKLQTMYDQYSFLNVAKAEDQEYLEGRLQSVKTIMDQYSSLDLSSSNLTGQLVNNMSQVVDDNVKNAVISTRIYQAEQSAWQKLQEESPEKYSQINHAYASQMSDAWLGDGKTGSTYRGGGGVIEYVDVEGKLSTKIPDIAKNIKAEWVELADGGGYFRDVVTKERVSRGQLESAMDGVLNEQDRRQMQINAWGAYDGMSDQELEASYSNHFAPKIQSLNDEIKSLEGTIQSTKDPALKEQRQGLVDYYREQLSAYEANSFTNVVQNYGREAAYNSLYDNQFRGNYLDTYSYTDRVTKIATYENDVHQRNYEFKLAEFDYKVGQDAIANQQKADELALKQQELALKGTGTGSSTTARPGTPGYTAPITGTPTTNFGGSDAALPYNEKGSLITEVQQQNKQLVEQTKKVFGITSAADTRELSKIFNEGFAGKEFIEFKGKKINVQENLPLLLEYQNKILSTSPVEKEAVAQYNVAIDKSLNNIRAIAQGDSPDWIAEKSVPNFSFYFKKNKETGVMERKSLGNNQNNGYAYLLKKESLSEDEKYTLDVYHRMHLLMDPKLSGAQKELVLKELQTNQFSKLSNEDYTLLSHNTAYYERLANTKNINLLPKTDIFGAGEASFTDIGGLGAATGKAVANRMSSEDKSVREPLIRPRDWMLSGVDYFLSDITAYDSEYYDKNGREISLESPAKTVAAGISQYENTLETEYKKQYLEPSLSPQIFSTSTSGYNTLATLVGLPEGSKMPITLLREWDAETQKPTGNVKWEYKVKGPGGEEATVSSESGGMLTEEQLRNNGVVNYGEAVRLEYDATWGKNSSVLDLGNNTYDSTIVSRNYKLFENDLIENRVDTQKLLDDSFDLFGPQFHGEMARHYTNFEKGAYEFKMESIDNIWQYTIYDNAGNRLYNEPTDINGISAYTSEEVSNIFTYNQLYVEQTMYNFMHSEYEKKRVEYLKSYEYQQKRSMTQ